MNRIAKELRDSVGLPVRASRYASTKKDANRIASWLKCANANAVKISPKRDGLYRVTAMILVSDFAAFLSREAKYESAQ